MKRTSCWCRVAGAAILALIVANGSAVADIRLLSAAAMQSVLKEIAGEFERTSGHRLQIDYATMGAINQRVLGGETADLVIGSDSSITGMVTAGKIQPDSATIICKVGVGVVVPSGTPKPTMATADDLKQALLAAKTVVYADPKGGGAAGIHVARVSERLGIADAIQPKIRYGAGGDATEVTLAQGSGALGMTQISEIVQKPGADFVGPFPGAVQNYTGVMAGVPTGVAKSEAVSAFLQFLRSPAAITVIRAKGMEID